MKTTHLNGLRALEATLRLGGFRAAADELGVTPAAVGQRVRALEDYLGRPLLERRPTGAVPAPAALSVAARLTDAMRLLSQALAELDGAAPDRRVAVSMPQALAETWLPPELPGFMSRCDSVDLRLDTSHLPVDLASGAFDFAVRYGPEPDKELDWLPLFPAHVVPVATPDFAERYGLCPGLTSLEHVPLWHVENHTKDPLWPDWAAWCARNGIAPPMPGLVPYVSRFSSGLRVAQTGLGMVLGGIVEAYPLLRDGVLVMPFGPQSALPTGAEHGYLYRLVWRRGGRLMPVQRVFRDWIGERAAAHAAAIEKMLAA